TVVALLKAGCDVTLVDNAGLTAAELADKCGQTVAAAVIRGEITADQALAATNGQT
ncbi:espin, partial [Biomphalaria pfeifferi]